MPTSFNAKANLGGCAASRDSDSGGLPSWVFGLLSLLARHRRSVEHWPHARGFVFLVTVGACLLPGVAHAQVDCSATGTTGVPQIECQALMALYTSTDGTNWTDSSNWDTASAVSSWFGVSVSGGQVTRVAVPTNLLTGTIPPEIGNLVSLTTLWLQDNQLTGALPSELGNLTNLTQLYLYNNQLTGAIPTELQNLTSLATLHLSGNQLTGTIPAELGNLTNLRGLYVYGNDLTGTIPPELGNLANVTTLHLAGNQFTGPLPPELENLSNLTALYLYGNQLSGPLPPWLGNLTSLSTLYLGSNQFTGTIPPELGNLTNLVSLFMYSNLISGPIPPELGNLTNLTTLYMPSSQLTGTIPPELGNLTSLNTLYLSSNELTGPIPPELGNLTNLTTIYLQGNQLTGTIPPELGNLTNLSTLYLYANQLTGTIPPELGGLTNLTSLQLSSNQLTGTIPPELGDLTNLTTLQLNGNQLTGAIPPELGNLTSLTNLRLSDNQLTGTIPPELGNLTNLTALYLYGNQLTGVIPPELANLTNLTDLWLRDNQLSGDVPDLSALPLTLLRLGINNFVFADFESEFLAYNDGDPATFGYSPQAMVDSARTESVPSGAPLVLPSAVAINPSGNDQYQWYKDGAPIAGPYGTIRDLDVTLGGGSVTPAQAGDYHYTINNSVVTGLALTSQTITVAVSATCGDGFLNDPSEVCDDGNLSTGDGCNAACLLEVGEPCTGDTDCASNRCNLAALPAVCAPPVGCGNGLLEAGEACDDGNNMNGDGCTAACDIEDGNPCAAHAECASGVCDMNEAPPLCEPAGSCGNGLLEAGEACDDGNAAAGDGCSDICLLEDGEPCTDHAECQSTICDTVGSSTCELADTCGNGELETGEACDDGNAAAGDGCDAECLFELGAGPCADNAQCASTVCDTLESNTCEPANRCGNGVLEAGEACDDGNTSPGDSCDGQCLLELGAGPCTDGAQCESGVCNTMAAVPVCAAPIGCGNGVLNDDEVCDDGNLNRGDGCSQSCTLENHWRGGGGCAVDRGRGSGGAGWLLSLMLLPLIRRRE